MQDSIIITQKDLDATPKPRLDSILSTCLQIPRTQALQLIKNQQVTLNDNLCIKPSTQITLNDTLQISIPNPQPSTNTHMTLDMLIQAKPEFLDISVVYEDNELLILNKPPHIVIHEAPSLKEPTLVDWLKLTQPPIRNLCGDLRYGIVHRLDRQTSGALAIAKTPHLTLLKHKERCQYLITIAPALDRFLLDCAEGLNVDPTRFEIPSDLKNFTKLSKSITSNTDQRFKALFSAIQEHEEIHCLRETLVYLCQKKYNADTATLKKHFTTNS